MAAVIKCDACGNTCRYSEAKHVRIHKLVGAESYSTATLEAIDVCPACYDKLCKLLKLEDKKK